MGMRTVGPAVDIVVFDDHAFRGEAIRNLLARSQVEGTSRLCPMEASRGPETETTPYLGIYVLGGRPLSDPATRETLSVAIARHVGVIPVALCDDHARDDVEIATAMGLRGLVLTSFHEPLLVAALHFVMVGGTYFPTERGHAPEIVPHEVAAAPPKLPALAFTARQCEVLEGLRHGHSNKAIARALDISEATVKIHVRQLMRKLGASNRTQVAIRAGEL